MLRLARPVKPRIFYEKMAEDLIKSKREELQLEYSELSKRLLDHGVHIDTRVLINKINRGNFSFTFALQVLAALEVKSVSVPNVLTDLD
jgi:hypothetical protein